MGKYLIPVIVAVVLALSGCGALGALVSGGQPDFADIYPTGKDIDKKVEWLKDQPAPTEGRIMIVGNTVYVPYDIWQSVLSDKVYLLALIDKMKEWGEKYSPITAKKALRRDLGTAAITTIIIGGAAGALLW